MKSFAKIYAFLLGLVLLLGMAGCGRGKSPAKFLEFGKKFYDQHEYARAREQFLSALSLQPTNRMAYTYLGKILYRQGQINESFQYLNAGRPYSFQEIESMEILATLFASSRGNTNHLAAARELMRAILERRPTNEVALRVLWQTTLDAESLDKGKSLLESLRKRAGDHAAFHVVESVFHLMGRNIPAAEAELEAALKLDPRSSLAYTQLAHLQSALKRNEESEASFRKAAEFSSPDSDARMFYARLLKTQKKIPEAKRVFDEINRLAPERIDALVQRAQIALDEKDYELCGKLLDKGMVQIPTDFEGRILQAKMYRQLTNYTASIQALQFLPEYRSGDKRVPIFKFELGVSQAVSKDFPNAIQNLNAAYRLDPTNQLNAATILGDLYLNLNRPTEALSFLRKVLEYHPDSFVPLKQLGQAYGLAGQFEEAIAHFEDMKSRGFVSPGVYYALGQYHKILADDADSQYQQAVERGLASEAAFAKSQKQRSIIASRREYTECLKLYPTYTDTVKQLVELELGENNISEAQKLLEPFQKDLNTDPALLLLRAKIRMAQKKRELAEVDLYRVIELNNNFYAAYVLLADLYLKSGDLEGAMRRLEAILVKDPKNLRSLMLKSLIVMDQNRNEEAVAVNRKILEILPQNLLALNNLAYLLSERLGKLDEGYSYASKAWQLDATSFRHADTLGWIEYRRGNYAGAYRLLRQSHSMLEGSSGRALRLDAIVLSEVQSHFGHASYQMGWEGPAQTAFQRALPMPTNLVGQELVLKRLEFLKRLSSLSNGELLSALEAQRKADPNDVLAALKLGQYHEARGDLDLARQSYEAALKVNSNTPPALVRLASLEVDRNAALANRLVRSAQSFQSDSPEIDWVLGRLALRGGDFAQAYTLLQSSLDRITNQPSLWLDCSKAAFGAGKLPESMDAAGNVIRMGAKPEQTKAASQIAEMLGLALNPAKAGASSEKIEAVLKAEPGHGPARFALGVSLAQRGKDKEAKAAFDAVLAGSPSCIAAVRELALLYGNRLGDDNKASELGTRARSAFPEDSDLARMLGLLAHRGGDHRYAVQLLADVASKESNDAELQYRLGKSLFELKRYDEAKAALEKAIAIEPNAKFVPDAKRMLKEGKTG